MTSKLAKLLFISLLISATSCSKDDDSEHTIAATNTTVKGIVVHHETPVPNARVFLKYDAIDFPGTDTTLYDLSLHTDSLARFKFNRVRSGKHYLFGIGYDTSIRDSVYGGIPIDLTSNAAIKEIDVPVTE